MVLNNEVAGPFSNVLAIYQADLLKKVILFGQCFSRTVSWSISMHFRTSQKKGGSPDLVSPTSKISKVINPTQKLCPLKNVTKDSMSNGCFAVELKVTLRKTLFL